LKICTTAKTSTKQLVVFKIYHFHSIGLQWHGWDAPDFKLRLWLKKVQTTGWPKQVGPKLATCSGIGK